MLAIVSRQRQQLAHGRQWHIQRALIKIQQRSRCDLFAANRCKRMVRAEIAHLYALAHRGMHRSVPMTKANQSHEISCPIRRSRFAPSMASCASEPMFACVIFISPAAASCHGIPLPNSRRLCPQRCTVFSTAA